jgi:hypothetical protein
MHHCALPASSGGSQVHGGSMKRSAIAPSTKPMKRGGFASVKKFEKKCRTIPSVREGSLSALTAISVKQRQPLKSKRKVIPAHELAHYRAVAALPCACCGIVGYSQAAHSNKYEDGKGVRLKANYRATFPLCCTRPGIVGCHYEHDNGIGMTREQADLRTIDYIANTLFQLGLRHD